MKLPTRYELRRRLATPQLLTRTLSGARKLKQAVQVIAKLPTIVSELRGLQARLAEQIAQRPSPREMVIARLELARQCALLGTQPWTTLTNAAYDQHPNPRVSVVVTLFNYVEHIVECLESVRAAELDHLPGGIEVIVVDDGSTDGSLEVATDYLLRANMPIALVKKALNTGLADARNVGVQLARAPYVFMLDADNWIYPNCLATLYCAIASGGHAAYGIINRFEHGTGDHVGLASLYDWDVARLIERPYIDAMAMFDKQTLLQLGGYSTELIYHGWFGWEDYDLWLKLAQAERSCVFVPQILSSYRVHPASMINSTNQYTVGLARYFSKKFVRLLRNHADIEILFGFPRDQIIQYGGQHDAAAPRPVDVAGVYEGAHEQTDCFRVAGWAWNKNQPNAPISVRIYDRDRLLATVSANLFRQDLRDQGKGNGYHAFSYFLPESLRDGARHVIRVRFAERDSDLPGTGHELRCPDQRG